jgi:hypothetical protein
MDEDDGFYFMRARYYEAGVGRFLSQDPIPSNNSINGYVYGNSNPITAIDPSGNKYTITDMGDMQYQGYINGALNAINCMGGRYHNLYQFLKDSIVEINIKLVLSPFGASQIWPDNILYNNDGYIYRIQIDFQQEVAFLDDHMQPYIALMYERGHAEYFIKTFPTINIFNERMSKDKVNQLHMDTERYTIQKYENPARKLIKMNPRTTYGGCDIYPIYVPGY